METNTYSIFDIYTNEPVGTIEMTNEQLAQYIEDCGPTGAITLGELYGRGSELETQADSDATVYVAV